MGLHALWAEELNEVLRVNDIIISFQIVLMAWPGSCGGNKSGKDGSGEQQQL